MPRDEVHLSSPPFLITCVAHKVLGARRKTESPILLPGSDYLALLCLRAFFWVSCIFRASVIVTVVNLSIQLGIFLFIPLQQMAVT